MKLIKQLIWVLIFAGINLNIALAVDVVPAGENVIGEIALQGGSNSQVIWKAPFSKTYKIYIKVPVTGNVANAEYRVYPKGKLPASIVCSTIDIEHPCFDIIVDQTQHQDGWVQLMVNNDTDTSWDFVEQSGFVAAVSSNLAAVETLNLSAAVKFEEQLALEIGNNYQGGIIFSLDATGRHGLIAAPTDQTGISIGVDWRSATLLCADLTIGAYDDWYLPSRNELRLMYRNIGPGAAAPLTNIGGFMTTGHINSAGYSDPVYWSSTLAGNGLNARGLNFATGLQNNYGRFGKNYVRAIRAF